MKVSILSATVEFFDQPFLKPLQLSSGLITTCTEARATVRVKVGEKEGEGKGSVYLSDLWAWPGGSLSREEKDAAMRVLCTAISSNLQAYCGGEAEHPLELGLRLHHMVNEKEDWQDIPVLARSVCASPFDAALHDATGDALGLSAFRFYEDDVSIPSADKYFRNGSAVASIRTLLRKPVESVDAWWLVSARDELAESMIPAVKEKGYRCYKLKVLAKDNQADVARTIEVYRTALACGVSNPIISLDSNEGNPDPAHVLEYLHELKRQDEDAFGAVAYLEQPTARDIVKSPFDWSAVSAIKPVMLDEGLTSLELLSLAKEQHWEGFALKTCKGHSFSLVCAAWGAENDMLLSLQDLTNPGYSAIHSYLFAAHIPTINGVELNSPQYTPAANEPWLPHLSGLFQPQAGVHRMQTNDIRGLAGSRAQISSV